MKPNGKLCFARSDLFDSSNDVNAGVASENVSKTIRTVSIRDSITKRFIGTNSFARKFYEAFIYPIFLSPYIVCMTLMVTDHYQ